MLNDDELKAVSVKRAIKDSVFKMLFSDRTYQAQLISELLNVEVKEDDEIKIKTLQSTFINNLVNDLTLFYNNKIILMLEEQSKWDEGLPFRFALYVYQTLLEEANKYKVEIHNGKDLSTLMPEIKLYIIYLGDDKEGVIDLTKDYPKINLNLKINIITKGYINGGIIDQYLYFCHSLNNTNKLYNKDKRVEALKECLEECKKRNCLVDFINEHEGEIIKMTMLIDSVESIDRQIRKRAKEEGLQQGLEQGLEQGQIKGALESQKNNINSLLNFYLKTMNYEDAKKLIIEALNIKEEDFEKAVKK